jgi:hypothetical protein
MSVMYPKYKGIIPGKNGTGTITMEFDTITQGVVVRVISRTGVESSGVEVPLVQLQSGIRTMADEAVHRNEQRSLVS